MAYPTLARLNSFPITVLVNGMHSDVTTIMKVKFHKRYCKNLFPHMLDSIRYREEEIPWGVGFIDY